MNLTDLETFVRAAQEGSLSAAARRLFISQPAVSARLRRLEQALGERLLERSGRGVRPTPVGSLLLARCHPLLQEVHRLEAEVRGEAPPGARLIIGATDLAAIYRLPRALASFRRRFPALEVQVQVEGSNALVHALEEGRIEFAIVTLPVASARVELTPLFEDPLRVVAAPGHPLAGRRSVAPKLVAAEAWLNHKRDSVTRRSLESFFASHDLALRTEMEISNPEAIKALVQARLGVAALPACAVEREVRQKLLVPIAVRGWNLSRVSGLAIRRGLVLSQAAEALIRLLRGGNGREGVTQPRRKVSRPRAKT